MKGELTIKMDTSKSNSIEVDGSFSDLDPVGIACVLHSAFEAMGVQPGKYVDMAKCLEELRKGCTIIDASILTN